MSNQYFGDDRIVHESLDVSKASSRRIYSNSEAPYDIVTRLRERALWISEIGFDDTGSVITDAADEIERLRAELKEAQNGLTWIVKIPNE